MKELFVVSSYHHVLTAIAKKYANNSCMDILISTWPAGNEYWIKYLDTLKKCGWFSNIFYFDEINNRPPRPNMIFKTIKYERGEETRLLESIGCNTLVDYDLVYLIDDKMFPGSTIVRNGYKYHLCEDTGFIYQLLKRTRIPRYLKRSYNIICFIFRLLNYWHPVAGHAKSCIAIETSSLEDLPGGLPKKKAIIVNRNELIDSIPEAEKQKILDVFLGRETLEEIKNNHDAIMVLTCPLKVIGNSPKIDNEFLIDVMDKLRNKHKYEKIIVKPHPRDDTEYQKYFQDLIVLPRSFPSEVLRFFKDFKIKEAISVGSTSVYSCNFAEKKTLITLKEFENEFH